MSARLLFLFVLLFSLRVQALPKITVESINGFEVHFVDLAKGNSFASAYQTNTGTLHDWGRFLGRAHLLEHLKHTGTLRYPGYHTFDKLLQPAGVQTNASTWMDRTMYYAITRSSQAELAMKVHLSMLGGLEWDPETVEKERKVVINEIVEEGNPSDSDAFLKMPFVQLLPPDHDWNRAMLGDLESLEGLSLDDLKEHYYLHYSPKQVRVALIGNFSDPQFKEQVRQWAYQYLKPARLQEDPHRYKLPEGAKPLNERFVPSLFSQDHDAPESQKRLYIHSDTLKVGGIFMQAPVSELPANPEALGLMISYLNLPLPGSFLYELTTKLGWISEGSLFQTKINNRAMLFFTYTMTDAGKDKAVEINEYFFRALKTVQEKGIPAETLALMARKENQSVETASRGIDEFMRLYLASFKSKKSLIDQMRDLAAVKPEEVATVARAFRPDQALYVVTGAEQPDMLTDQVFRRKYKIEDNRPALARYVDIVRGEESQASFAPVFKPVDLGELSTAPVTPYFLQSKPDEDGSESFVLHSRRDLDDAAVTAEFHLMPAEPGDLVIPELVAAAFTERYASELAYIRYKYFVNIKFERTGNVFAIKTTGNDAYAARALAWVIDKLREYVPSGSELDRAREAYADDLMTKYIDDFSAIIGASAVKNWLDPYEITQMSAREAALKMKAQEIWDGWKVLTLSTHLNLVATGALPQEDVYAVRQAARRLSPVGLSPEQRERMQSRFRWVNDKQQELEMPFPAPKGADSYALTRLYRGPQVNDAKASAAFLALGEWLGDKVSNYNRGDQHLGYIHRAVPRPLDNEYYFMIFVGGTDGKENAGKTVAGWKHVMNLLATGQVPEQEIKNAISGVLNRLSAQKTSARDLVDSYATQLNVRKDARGDRKVIEALQGLTPEDVLESARRYLLADGAAYTQLTLSNCDRLLSSNEVAVDKVAR